MERILIIAGMLVLLATFSQNAQAKGGCPPNTAPKCDKGIVPQCTSDGDWVCPDPGVSPGSCASNLFTYDSGRYACVSQCPLGTIPGDQIPPYKGAKVCKCNIFIGGPNDLKCVSHCGPNEHPYIMGDSLPFRPYPGAMDCKSDINDFSDGGDHPSLSKCLDPRLVPVSFSQDPDPLDKWCTCLGVAVSDRAGAIGSNWKCMSHCGPKRHAAVSAEWPYFGFHHICVLD